MLPIKTELDPSYILCVCCNVLWAGCIGHVAHVEWHCCFIQIGSYCQCHPTFASGLRMLLIV